ncbi:laccase-1 precursor [Penicillium capsulatum]|uniref:Laccase-1 n=1 Tax=Penicillium capsulatum TaxID=69766 RepID=A0A9W9ILZ1_9EURO|nr:laccase-1 precursor [Penicillium capsulatum]KAJ6121575.1 laccase-1 precursor [Penicillium capsulatum]
MTKSKLVWDTPIDGLIKTLNADEWVYLFINNTHTADHPIHLTSQGDQDTMHNYTPMTRNPPRRDTAGWIFRHWLTNRQPGGLVDALSYLVAYCGGVWLAIPRAAKELIPSGVLNDTTDQFFQQWIALHTSQGEYKSGF